jgi:hypothetical protein
MRLCAVSEPPHSVHGSPWTSPGVHWVQASLAHDWRTGATVCVLLEGNVPRSRERSNRGRFWSQNEGRSRGPSVLDAS